MAFSPESMSKVNLFVQSDKLKEITNLLYDLKLVQFFDLKEKSFEKFEHNDLNEISHELLQTRSSIRLLKDYFKVNTNKPSVNPIEEILKTKTKLDDLEKKVIIQNDELRRTNILTKLKVKSTDISNPDLKVGFVGLNKKSLLNKLKSSNIKFNTFSEGKRVYFVCRTTYKIPFEFKDLYLPQSLNQNLISKIEKTRNSIKKAKLDLRNLSNNNIEHLRAKEHHLTKELEILESQPSFAKTQNIVIISGHMPTNKIRKFKIELVRLLTDKFELSVEKATSDKTPIKLNHNKLTGNFVELLKMYSLPKYNEIDPTFFMFLTFPIFFGFILGDVIYGLISLIFFTFLKIKMPKIKEFCSILQMSAISSILFGIIYGEFMGYEIHGAFYGLIARSHEATTLLGIAVVFGILHINLGLILGFVNELSNKHTKKAICDKLSFIVMQVGVGLLAYGVSLDSNQLTIIGSVTTIFAIALIYMGHGFIGIMEIPSFFTNILSYARLMAVGLSSVVIAMLVNQYTELFFSYGPLGIIAAILMFSIGHIFNIILGNFEGFVHTLRLHYVEQMTKFYSGGGEEFIPFGERKIDQE
jgi:V/A-type H+-transporting ATPase subunit I